MEATSSFKLLHNLEDQIDFDSTLKEKYCLSISKEEALAIRVLATKFKILENKDIPLCLDCSQDPEYYMVTSEIWKKAGFKNSLGIICIDCLEKRLNKRLGLDDFSDVPLNKLVRRMLSK